MDLTGQLSNLSAVLEKLLALPLPRLTEATSRQVVYEAERVILA
jgi:hypothetical protein